MRALCAAALLTLAAGCSGGNEDCAIAEADWGKKTQHIGDECWAGSYGTCDRLYDDCLQGTCHVSGDGNRCSYTCSSNSTCPSSLPYCKNGFCTQGASCHTFCDEYWCCTYSPDPADPTTCKQGSCSCS